MDMVALEQAAVVGRAASAIYAICKAHNMEGQHVLVPSNVCYAAVFPVAYAGARPVFCDVEAPSGNVSLRTIQKACEGLQPAAVLVAHMYGNPLQDIRAIASWCKDAGLILIEDCASAMGATLPDGAPVGSFGDYAVYSTGYAKTVEVGFGGLVTAAPGFLVSEVIRICSGLPCLCAETEERDALFSRLYRALRNSSADMSFKRLLFTGWQEAFRDVFLCSISPAQERRVREAVVTLGERAELRRLAQRRYEGLLQGRLPGSEIYPYGDGAVPWRFSVRVPANFRPLLVEESLKRNVPISDWYPSIEGLFSPNPSCAVAKRLGEEMVNLPLTVPMDDIARISDDFAAAYQEAKGRFNA